MTQIAAVILAAGSGRRFGSNKMLATLKQGDRELPLLAFSLQPWLEVFERLTVVTQAGDDAIKRSMKYVLDRYADIQWVECPDADKGMGLSLACGIQHTVNAEGWVIGLGDMPQIPSSVISKVRDGLIEGNAIVVPFCEGRRGHPIGLSSLYKPQLLMLDQDTGAKHLLEQNASFIKRIDVTDTGICADIDTPSDLDYLQSTLNK
ncbi:hypothetical protein A7981_06170 [Methylovorus sp. MM2]|uniref:nucleotidyltransferase family protein n=1 Tax=Methylovorus sp. MM2 TaxID=1848038 RepID=UPI0007E2887B|nr:nucleotidyltransferase family protein [Methylovorus sp. MM2]OAM53013.1 hypothetical protein A7981_06170 [Methylovorus sp. MM2]